jgi:hypothetical protein
MIWAGRKQSRRARGRRLWQRDEGVNVGGTGQRTKNGDSTLYDELATVK